MDPTAVSIPGENPPTASTLLAASLESPVSGSDPASIGFILYFLSGLLLSIIIILQNLLVSVSLIRLYRSQSASNVILLSLSLSDGLQGVALAAILLLQYAGQPREVLEPELCLLPYCLLIVPVVVSMLCTMVIAVDRFASLAWPLRYNNLVTRRHVLWTSLAALMLALLVASTPLLQMRWSALFNPTSAAVCSLDLLNRLLASILIALLFIPVVVAVSGSYLYVFCVARVHVKAIQTVEQSLGRKDSDCTTCRCGQMLMLTVGTFLCCWTPLCFCLATQNSWFFSSSVEARGWLLLLATSSAALNPVVYGFHNAELRFICLKTLDIICGKMGKSWWRNNAASTGMSTGSNIRLCVMSTQQPQRHCIVRDGLTTIHQVGENGIFKETTFSTPKNSRSPIIAV